MKKDNLDNRRANLNKGCLLMLIPLIVIGNNIGHMYLMSFPEGDFLDRILWCIENGTNYIFAISFHFNSYSISGSVFAVICLFLFWAYHYFDTKNNRHDEEYGSAKWSTKKDIAPKMAKNYDDNQILTETERLSLDTRQTKVNNNILVIGSAGTGKTRFHVKPNIMQLNSNYIVTDPKGSLIKECGKLLSDNGYHIKSFNAYNFDESMHYNPFVYIKQEEDILSLVNTIIMNTKGEGNQSGEDFWVKAERLLYTAYIAFIYYELGKDDKTFSTLIDMIVASETKEDVEDYKNGIDILFEDLEERIKFDDKNPSHFALRQYKSYKLAAGKTAKSILISCGARLAPFDITRLRDITSRDDLDLKDIATEKVALFLCPSDSDPTFNFMFGILYTQLFQILSFEADYNHDNFLPRHCKFILDEFANIAQIPNFEKTIAVIRSRNISVTVILQTLAQLKDLYKDKAEIITGNCSSWLFLGGKEKSTLKELSEVIGKETIDVRTYNESRGSQGSYTINNQKIARDLLSSDEIATMSNTSCLLLIDGIRPFFSNKFPIEKHKNYKFLSDFNKDNTYYLKKNLKKSLIDVADDTKLTLYSEN